MTKHTKTRLKWGAWGSLTGVIVIIFAALAMRSIPPAMARSQTIAAAKAEVQAAEKVAATKLALAANLAAAKVLAATSQPESTPAIVLVKPDDPKGAAAVVQHAMHTSNWRLVVLAGLLLTVLLLRKVGGFLLPTKAATWISSDRGGATLALLAGVLTVVVNGMIAGGTFDPQLLIDGVLAAATTAGGFNLAKKLAKPSDLPATPAGPDAPKLDGGNR